MVLKKITKKPITLADVAATAGVTQMTVSRVINGNRYVNDELRKRVLQVVSDLNYRPNHLARSLKLQRTETIGLVLPDLANPFTVELARGVRQVFGAKGYNVFICIAEQSAKDEVKAFDSLVEHRVDGLIVATRASKLGNDRLSEILNMNVPLVLIGRDFRHPQADFVGADHLRGGYDATLHLIERGHKRIGFIGVSLTNGLGLKRFQGYLEALREHHLPIDENLIVSGENVLEQTPGYSTETMGYHGMKQLLTLKQRPTAVFTRNDFTAFGAINAIKETGLSIPEDIAIVGFDDVPLAKHITPALTTIYQPTSQQGELAAELLLARIENQQSLLREEKILNCQLIVRKST
jgi:DNA-binding LacI/PurR family transcriptional regulator